MTTMKVNFLVVLIGLAVVQSSYAGVQTLRDRRSIDLSAAHALIPDTKLPTAVVPNCYTLELRPDFEDNTFSGKIIINVTFVEDASEILLHAHSDLEIQQNAVTVREIVPDSNTEKKGKELKLRRFDRQIKKPIVELLLKEDVKKGTMAEIELQFNGVMWEGASGLFRGSYNDKNNETRKFVATHFRPTEARRTFPCFDEPAFKALYCVRIARPKNLKTLFVTPLKETKPINGNEEYVMDYFETTPLISTYALGFVISDLQPVNTSFKGKVPITIYARTELKDDLQRVYPKVDKVLQTISEYMGAEYPLPKLDIVALPGLVSVKPIDIWGLTVFKESELLYHGYYTLAQELVYSWLGNWVSPQWWSDAHVNKALAGFLAAYTTIAIDNGVEFEGKYPMTILYSIYYEFSKRYPHSRITGMKQETTSSKTELVLRMLNFTLGGETFKKAMQTFINTYKYKTFQSSDVWAAITRQGHADKTLPDSVSINEIVSSWINKDRIPVVNVKRDYKTKTAVVTQRVYLRERPHDVPERDKLLWWIPLIVVTQNKHDFDNYKPMAWMKNEKTVTLNELPGTDQYIIVNPEEIGPFPVNYDDKNWDLLAAFLQTDKREEIPVYTRAKLLHDAWNLAYAGNLSFSTALNMTLFIKNERNHLVWNPVFTLIDHIGRHIDMSPVHKKFETYVCGLLTPLYEELGPQPVDGEKNWKTNLRSLAETFLCRAGYKPCIEEAQKAYKKWMDSENPDDGNPVANQYICPVFKWGTMEEWEFGLQRVINFPKARTQSERTYILKTLAGCPIQKEKIERLLNITIIEENSNFTEYDVPLIFNMLTGSSNGYATLFQFLETNWDLIKTRFESNPTLWNNLISAATGVFTTQQGYDMVKRLYDQRKGQFGSAEHVIEKSLKNIKEETKWSDENLPVIEKWLNEHVDSNANPKFMGKK